MDCTDACRAAIADFYEKMNVDVTIGTGDAPCTIVDLYGHTMDPHGLQCREHGTTYWVMPTDAQLADWILR